jgi:hypothetical protein
MRRSAEAVDVQATTESVRVFVVVLIGGLAMGKYLVPATALAGERSAEEIRRIVAGLE